MLSLSTLRITVGALLLATLAGSLQGVVASRKFLGATAATVSGESHASMQSPMRAGGGPPRRDMRVVAQVVAIHARRFFPLAGRAIVLSLDLKNRQSIR